MPSAAPTCSPRAPTTCSSSRSSRPMFRDACLRLVESRPPRSAARADRRRRSVDPHDLPRGARARRLPGARRRLGERRARRGAPVPPRHDPARRADARHRRLPHRRDDPRRPGDRHGADHVPVGARRHRRQGPRVPLAAPRTTWSSRSTPPSCSRASRKALDRQARELGASPTTQLPGADAIQAEIERRLATAMPTRGRLLPRPRQPQGVQRLLRLREGERGDPPDRRRDPPRRRSASAAPATSSATSPATTSCSSRAPSAPTRSAARSASASIT